jgi:hypothetical protein
MRANRWRIVAATRKSGAPKNHKSSLARDRLMTVST